MTTDGQQSPNAPATYGYRQIPPVEPSGIALSVMYAAVGVIFGILTGTALASATWPASTAAASPDLTQVSSSAPELNIHPIANAGQTAALARQTDNPGDEQLSPPLASTAGKTPAAHKHHALRRLSAAKKSSARRQASSMRRPSVTPYAPVAAPLPAAGNVLRLDAAAAPSDFIIEGDVSVADYDATQGIITTDEGRNFVLDRTAGAGDATIWQEYHANIHYRCDRAGNCTLMRAGLYVSTTQLSI